MTGKCNFCGEDAGFLKSKHKACEEKYNEGMLKIKAEIANIFNETGFYSKLERYITAYHVNLYTIFYAINPIEHWRNTERPIEFNAIVQYLILFIL